MFKVRLKYFKYNQVVFGWKNRANSFRNTLCKVFFLLTVILKFNNIEKLSSAYEHRIFQVEKLFRRACSKIFINGSSSFVEIIKGTIDFPWLFRAPFKAKSRCKVGWIEVSMLFHSGASILNNKIYNAFFRLVETQNYLKSKLG